MMEIRDATADFKAEGPRYGAARRILERGCEVPPSLEVFEHQLKLDQEKNPRLCPEALARRLSESYHRTQGFFGENG